MLHSVTRPLGATFSDSEVSQIVSCLKYFRLNLNSYPYKQWSQKKKTGEKTAWHSKHLTVLDSVALRSKLILVSRDDSPMAGKNR